MMRPDESFNCSGECSNENEVSAGELNKRDTRALVFHLLYAMDSFDYTISLESVADNFNRGFNYTIKTTDQVFLEAQAIIADREKLDTEIKPLLDNWRYERLGVCTRLIMRLALWEFTNTDTQPTIIINEAIELAKCFAELDAYKFINGVLDEWVKRNKPEAQNKE